MAVSAILPTVAMSMVENEKLRSIAVQVEQKLKKVIDSKGIAVVKKRDAAGHYHYTKMNLPTASCGVSVA